MNETLKHSHIMGSKSVLILILLISIAIVFYGRRFDANAQDIKGGSRFSSSSLSSSSSGAKGAGQFSRFKENILSVQQQQFARPVQVSRENVETVSSSSFIKQPVETSISNFKNSFVKETSSSQQQSTDAEPTIYGAVEGVPGVDFPGFTTIPNTQFSCEGRPFEPGMYADESTGCQVYHLCYSGRRESFLCGIGTVFNQAIMNCDFWHSVDCSKSSEFYHLNSEFGKASAEPGSGGSSFSSKQEVSSTFNRLPAVPIGGKTSFSSEQFSSSVQVNPPPPVVSTSSFSRTQSTELTSGKVSAPKISTLQSAFSSVKGGSSFRGSGSFLSPGRQVQLNRLGVDVDGGQLAAASSNRIKVKTGSKTIPVSSAKIIVNSGESSKVSANDRPSQIDSARINEVQSNNSNEEWKPYFKSKTNQKGNQASNSGSGDTNSGQSSTTPQPTTMARVDQDPVFSSAGQDESKPAGPASSSSSSSDELPKVPKSGSPPETTAGAAATPASPEGASPSAGIEPDVGPALVTTTPSPPVTTPGSSAGGGEQPMTTTTGAPAAASESEASNESASGAPTTGSEPAGETESSVEYASSAGTTTTTTASPSSADEASKRKRKRKKKKRNERNSS